MAPLFEILKIFTNLLHTKLSRDYIACGVKKNLTSESSLPSLRVCQIYEAIAIVSVLSPLFPPGCVWIFQTKTSFKMLFERLKLFRLHIAKEEWNCEIRLKALALT